MHEIIVREDGTITLADAAILCGVEVGAIHSRLQRGLIREVRREGYRILVGLLDVIRSESMMRGHGKRVPGEVSLRLEGEPDVDMAAVLQACLEAAQQAVPVARQHLVYYVRFADRIKIGTMVSGSGRLEGIPHDEVLATEPGGAELERQRHAQFAAYRITGEWFSMAPEIMQHAAGIAARYPLVRDTRSARSRRVLHPLGWTHTIGSWETHALRAMVAAEGLF